MKIAILILNIFIISLNIFSGNGQSSDGNDLIKRDLEVLITNTQKIVREYLATILVDAIIQNVDKIFTSASLNLTSLINNQYNCGKITTTSTTKTTTAKTTTKTTTKITTTTTRSTTKINTTITTRTTTSSKTTITAETTAMTISNLSLLDVFSNYTLKSEIKTLNGNSFFPSGFAMDSTKTRYYITDYAFRKIYILNDEYQYISETLPFKYDLIKSIGSNLYILGSSNSEQFMWKTDENLNVLIQYNTTGLGYADIYFNSKNRLMYITVLLLNSIHIFDLNLNLVDSIVNVTFSTEPSQSPSNYPSPHSISGFKNRLYVGCTRESLILVIENKQVINTFNGCSGWLVGDNIYSILSDQSGYIAISCFSYGLYLYDSNLSYTGKRILPAGLPMSSAFDSKGRLVVITAYKISLYY